MTTYLEQTIRVEPGRGVHDDAVRVIFRDVTLAMSLVEASWLIANVGRIMREVEAAHPELSSPTWEELKALKLGEVVRVRDDEGREENYLVKYAPWQLGNGHWVIGLSGISGGYSLERVVKIIARMPR